MTDEDMQLIARAMMCGARFTRTERGSWSTDGSDTGWFTMGRAASSYLYEHDRDRRSLVEHNAYLKRTELSDPDPTTQQQRAEQWEAGVEG